MERSLRLDKRNESKDGGRAHVCANGRLTYKSKRKRYERREPLRPKWSRWRRKTRRLKVVGADETLETRSRLGSEHLCEPPETFVDTLRVEFAIMRLPSGCWAFMRRSRRVDRLKHYVETRILASGMGATCCGRLRDWFLRLKKKHSRVNVVNERKFVDLETKKIAIFAGSWYRSHGTKSRSWLSKWSAHMVRAKVLDGVWVLRAFSTKSR